MADCRPLRPQLAGPGRKKRTLADTTTSEIERYERRVKRPVTPRARIVHCVVTGEPIWYSGYGRPPLYSPAVAYRRKRDVKNESDRRRKVREAEEAAHYREIMEMARSNPARKRGSR